MSPKSRKPFHRAARGATLIVVVMLVTVLLGLVASLMVYAGGERVRAVASSRTGQRQSCAESGLQLARSYYGRNYSSWNTYLAAPTIHDPVRSTFNPTPADPFSTALRTANRALFADVDGDGEDDVYLYIRDNEDEFDPVAPNWRRDNDQVVVVGAVCISKTLRPRRSDGTQSPTTLALEGLLSYNGGGGANTSQGTTGTGSGNHN
ncbi:MULTISPECIES: hypothetical protein [Myxococcus]|uniref:Type 4 fimbrial biogenesis protein PilX N-terminal domain-containing protein n=1 Tax=Myxococcus llanfairpwllgwyngyllgogerychwyrndrobwllllantysiliogogogochensis TaxID=2590453 RepID=A0A540X306_9BACT|nr:MULTISPECIES: hypothetical protein [Myxococcus]NTX04990.1 hypothetical protein [Myxococcus sp. CA040A]TQF15620.1 hypothetical protein FJV41_12565 [Myxococcus llanfairpwllgwyngyllgogerychwyrndrobwllllantysiliogogogochensis]